jgi:C4-dicarboxylate-binding protein DctP
MKAIISSIIAVGLSLGLTTMTAFAQQPVVIKFSHVVALDTPKGKSIEYFKKLVEERSKGAIKVDVYPNSQLYKDKEELEAIQLGAVQMLAPSLGKFGPLGIREFDVFNLPFLFENDGSVDRVTQGKIGKDLLKKLETRGITGLTYWDNGYFVMTANKALKKPEDFRGLKIRVQSSKVSEAEVRSLGAMPQVVAFSEVYQALQTGVVDGSDFPTLTNLYTQKIYEVQKHITLSNHSYLGYAVIINKKFWEALSEQNKRIIAGAIKDSTSFNNQLVKKDTDDALAKIKATGRTEVHTLSNDEKRQWKKAMLKVHTEMAGRIGKDLIDAVYKDIGFDPNK